MQLEEHILVFSWFRVFCDAAHLFSVLDVFSLPTCDHWLTELLLLCCDFSEFQ